MDIDFVFTVEGMTHEQADELLDTIVQEVEKRNLRIGGGFYENTEQDALHRIFFAAKYLWFEICWAVRNGKE